MSNAFNPDGSKFRDLKDKVIVLTGTNPLFTYVSRDSLISFQTGGANGIGACTVRDLHKVGAKIVFGDFDTKNGEALASALKSDVYFMPMDVSKYDDNLALFKLALEKFGRIDHAVAVAGIAERGDWFNSKHTISDVQKPETNATVEINYLGVLYFTRIALPYLREARKEGEDKSLVLVGSAAGFRESPGLPIYQSTKHGVQGIMRSLRKQLWEKEKIRINVLCPGVTDTNMADVVAAAFRANGLEEAVNVPEDLAITILGMLSEKEMWGKGVYVEGAKGWELEAGQWDTMPIWLGEAPTRRLRAGLELVASVS